MLFRPVARLVRLPIVREQVRSASIISALNSSPVLVSSNRDIYTNLALEHWLYTNLRFNQDVKDLQDKPTGTINFNHPVVLIWTDEPCIVIGRHQNPWVETNLGLVNKLGIKIARRHSGGGCVYHDENNINISIIGDRKVFDGRQENLRFLAKIIGEKYAITCEPNKRHDLIHTITGKKMSGSAAKLGRFNSYHHFTLLVNTDTEIMHAAIRRKQQDFIDTKSTASTRSDVINLSELKPDLTTEQVITDLAQSYGRRHKTPDSQAGKDDTRVEGDRDEFESLTKFRDELMSWKWMYGMTPKFKLERTIDLMAKGQKVAVHFRVHINRGLFESFEIDCELNEIRALAGKFSHLVGTSFAYKEAMTNVAKMLQVDEKSIVSNGVAGGEQIFATYLLQMIYESNLESIGHQINSSEASI